jgi:nucleoside-diphosphate-sugar epimerase
MKFLVTGATGFIGGAVAASLRFHGSLTVLSRQPFSGDAVDAFRHDLAEPVRDMENLKGAAVIHCAAEIRAPDWESHWRGNVLATRNILEWAVKHQARRFVMFSTGSVYGFRNGRRMRETDSMAPFGHYGYSKYIAEELCRIYSAMFKLPMVVFRLYFPFGPGLNAGMFRLIENAVRSGSRLQITENGAPNITPVHIDDVVQAVMLSLGNDFPEGIYNLCGDEDISFLELVRKMEARLGTSAHIELTSETGGDMLADNSRLRQTGWTPRRTIDSYLNQILFKEAK